MLAVNLCVIVAEKEPHKAVESTEQLDTSAEPQPRELCENSLTGHLDVSIEPSVNPHRCDASSLQEHAAESRVALKPYRCQTCDERFASASACLSHCLSAHKSPGNKSAFEDRVTAAAAAAKNNREMLNAAEKNPPDDVVVSEKPHRCEQCGRCFGSRLRVSLHAAIHADVNAYKCGKCGEAFVHLTMLLPHLRDCRNIAGAREDKAKVPATVSSEVMDVDETFSVVSCQNVDFTDSSKTDIAESDENIPKFSGNSRDTGASSGSFKCLECSECFAADSELDVHMLLHTPRNKPHRCETCGERFEFADGLSQHATCRQVPQPPRCHVCDQHFDSNDDLEIHLQHHANDNCDVRNKTHNCQQCRKSFVAGADLTEHVKTCRTFKCLACDSSFSDAGFKLHMTFHRKKPHCCRMCRRHFISSSQLTAHARSHLTSTLSCSVCDMRFRLKYFLEQHTKSHVISSSKTTKRDFVVCDKCGWSCRGTNRLERHRAVCRGCRQETVECLLCQKIWTNCRASSNRIDRHVRACHTDADSTVCSTCRVTFATLRQLLQHMKSEHVRRRHCPVIDARCNLDDEADGKSLSGTFCMCSAKWLNVVACNVPKAAILPSSAADSRFWWYISLDSASVQSPVHIPMSFVKFRF